MGGNKMSRLQVSIIIPTYNRVKELEECLDSILVQTYLPKEIIIVDDSDDLKIERLINSIQDKFKSNKIYLNYLKNENEKGLTIARNLSVVHSTGEIVLFLDDDVVLEREYIEEIIKIYRIKPDALGVQGHITNLPKICNISLYSKIFFNGRFEKNKCRVLPSLQASYPNILTKVITCEWMSGSNCSYKRWIFDEFQFDENLKRYSYNEDVDFSSRVNKKYPASLFITPGAKLIHNVSQTARLSTKNLYIMKHSYSIYLFNKISTNNLLNKFIFIWNKIGILMGAFVSLIIKPSKLKIYELYYIIFSYYICIKFLTQIKNGHLNFLKL